MKMNSENLINTKMTWISELGKLTPELLSKYIKQLLNKAVVLGEDQGGKINELLFIPFSIQSNIQTNDHLAFCWILEIQILQQKSRIPTAMQIFTWDFIET